MLVTNKDGGKKDCSGDVKLKSMDPGIKKYFFFDESAFFFSDPTIHKKKMWEICD